MDGELSKDWKWVKLGEVCTIQTGKYDANHAKPKGKYRFYTCAFAFMFCETNRFKGESLILPGNGANVGEVFYYNGEFDAYQRTYVLNEIKTLPKYLYYHLLGNWKRKNQDKQFGSATNYIRMGNFTDYKLPVPPKPTQLAIVSKIEELFSELEKGIESLFTAKQQLKTYRQSVLKWAFVNNTFKDFLLKDVTEKIQIGPFGTQLHKEDYIENGIPLINPTHLKNGLIVADNSFSILKSKRNSLPNYILKAGDVIMGRRGEMGRCGLVTKKEAGWFCGTGSLYFRPDTGKVNSVFLYYYLRSEPVKKYLDENAGGTTMANLNLKIVNDIPISLPSIEEQYNIVQEIESHLSVADKMEESITQSLQQAEALKQSILKKAFEGKLI